MTQRPHLTLVVAVDANNGIGIENRLPWQLPADLAHFKRVTLGKPIVMGRKTFDSIGRPLPGRRNIVITRNSDWSHPGVEAALSLDAAVALLGNEAASIIGGAQVFDAALALADTLIVTHIARSYPCDTFFPTIDPAIWTETAREPQRADDQDLDYAFVTYTRHQDAP